MRGSIAVFLAGALWVSGGGCGGDGAGATGTIQGTITDDASAPLILVSVSLGTLTQTTDNTGTYLFENVPPGQTTVTVEKDWYEGDEASTTVEAGKINQVDFQLNVGSLMVLSADAALAATYNNSFDWGIDKVSITEVPSPTRAQLELAIHYNNPALYENPSNEAQITPSTLPEIGNSNSFDFVVDSGAQSGQQVLDRATVVNTIGSTPLTTGEIGDTFLWGPGVDFLIDWDFGQSEALFTAGVAVRQQLWGGSPDLDGQAIERGYLDADTGDIWVKIVFQDFVTVAGDVTDTDLDGLKEVYARVNSVHFGSALFAELRSNYIESTHTTLELRDIVNENMDVLYSKTNPFVLSTIGVPYTNSALGGEVQYPFVVIEHDAVGVINVLLLRP